MARTEMLPLIISCWIISGRVAWHVFNVAIRWKEVGVVMSSSSSSMRYSVSSVVSVESMELVVS